MDCHFRHGQSGSALALQTTLMRNKIACTVVERSRDLMSWALTAAGPRLVSICALEKLSTYCTGRRMNRFFSLLGPLLRLVQCVCLEPDKTSKKSRRTSIFRIVSSCHNADKFRWALNPKQQPLVPRTCSVTSVHTRCTGRPALRNKKRCLRSMEAAICRMASVAQRGRRAMSALSPFSPNRPHPKLYVVPEDRSPSTLAVAHVATGPG